MATLGDTTIEASSAATPAGYHAATGPYTMPAGGGTLSDFQMYIDPSGQSADFTVRLALYNDNAGVPGSRFSYSDEKVITHGGAAGWVSFPVTSGQATALVAGNKYWVATCFGNGCSGSPNWYKQKTTGTQYYKSASYTTGSPPSDPFPSSPSSNAVEVSRYVDYTTGGGATETLGGYLPLMGVGA